jgi:hypothetical protein
LAKKRGCLPHSLRSLQLFDAFPFFVGKAKLGKQCARFDEEERRGDEDELRGLTERKPREFFHVGEISVAHFGE